MSWEAVTALGTAFTGLVIVATALVGADQLRQLRAQRRDSAAVELVRSLQDTDFTRAFRLIFSLPPGCTASDLRARGPEYEDAAELIGIRFEMLGMLVHRRTVSFDVMEDLAAGATMTLWERLKGWAIEARETRNFASYMEWFQWLAEQLMKRDRVGRGPAHQRYADWTPRRG